MKNIQKFFKSNIVARYGIPHVVITDDGTQFMDRKLINILEEFNVKQHFMSLKHTQTNIHVKPANWVILIGLKQRLARIKGNLEDEPPHVFWAYKTTPHLTTNETPF